MFSKDYSKLFNAIILFLTIYLIVNIIKPGFIFDNRRNCLRQFGIGYKNTSVITLWVFTILLAISCYFAVYYVDYLNNSLF